MYKKILVLALFVNLLFACEQSDDSAGEGSSGILTDVEVSDISMDFTFNQGKKDYSGSCSYSQPSVMFTLTLDDETTSANINTTEVFSGQSCRYPLEVGDNVIVISDRVNNYTYTIRRKTVAEEMNTPCPDYPLPGYYEGEITSGSLSEELIVEEDVINNYHPYLSGTEADSWEYDIDVDDGIIEHCWIHGFRTTQDINVVDFFLPGDDFATSGEYAPLEYLNSLPLVEGGIPIEYEGVSVGVVYYLYILSPYYFHDNYSRYFSTMCDVDTIPVYDVPRLQRVRYWKCISSANIGSGSHTFSETRTVGVTKSSTEIFLEAEVDASLDLSELSFDNLSAQFMEITVNGYMNEVSLTEQDEFTFAETAYSVDGAISTTAVLWQLVEEFRVVDGDGNIFNDPFYQIDDDRSPRVLHDEKKVFVISTVPTY